MVLLYKIDILPSTSNIITHISFANEFSIQYSQICFFQFFLFLGSTFLFLLCMHFCCICKTIYAISMRFSFENMSLWDCDKRNEQNNKRTDRFTNSIETSASDFLSKKRCILLCLRCKTFQSLNINNRTEITSFAWWLFQSFYCKLLYLKMWFCCPMSHQKRNNNSFIRIKLNVYLLWNPVRIGIQFTEKEKCVSFHTNIIY